jgi:ABC-type multidrug transport system fused ATPase/permease subunit
VLGQQIALFAQQYPAHRNVTLRALEPLGAPEEAEIQPVPSRQGARVLVNRGSEDRDLDDQSRLTHGVAIALEGVSVRAGGHVILEDVNLDIEPGRHIAIVGPSGAGKSSLVGLLLGWHRPATGQIFIEGEPLASRRLESLRQEMAWVDPTVHLWNRSLFENLSYGAPDNACLPINSVIEAADLRSVLERLPDGLQTSLGEGGALVSGGEGQRVRLGRAMLRSHVRLVILDEPFRGLDRERRRQLLIRARKWWRDATLICITHDVGETLSFERVLVVNKGRIVEDGPPYDLAERPDSRYRHLLDAEEAVRVGLWASPEWRHLRIEGGRLFEQISDPRLQIPDIKETNNDDPSSGRRLLASLKAGRGD